MILSWNDSLQGAATTNDGHNVVIHEFAHQLDQENGPANGAPPMAGGAARVRRWTEVFSTAFSQLQQQLAQGEPTLIDGYGATNPAEFFAEVPVPSNTLVVLEMGMFQYRLRLPASVTYSTRPARGRRRLRVHPDGRRHPLHPRQQPAVQGRQEVSGLGVAGGDCGAGGAVVAVAVVG